MGKKAKAVLMIAVMLLMAGTSAFAEGSNAGNAVVSGISSLVRMPITILHKASDSLDNGTRSARGSEDVMVGDIYSLDAETTG